MSRTASVSRWVAAALLLCGAGCARRAPLAEPMSMDKFAHLAAPLEVREFEVVGVDEHRGLFIKLSRLPDSVSHHVEYDPASIVLEIGGPTGGESPEESFPGHDGLVQRLRITRTFGGLRVAIDLQGGEVPDYSVHQLADYIMVRLAPPG
jgi:hypothetical protein